VQVLAASAAATWANLSPFIVGGVFFMAVHFHGGAFMAVYSFCLATN